MDDDAALLRRYRNGEAAAFTQLYERHRLGLFRFLLGLCGDHALAEEVFQDTWMNLIRSAPGAEPGVTVGVRPEHLDITPDGWALTVDALETLGAERLVYGRWQHGEGGELVIIRTDEGFPAPALGSTIHVTPRPDRLHHFDTATGKRL